MNLMHTDIKSFKKYNTSNKPINIKRKFIYEQIKGKIM